VIMCMCMCMFIRFCRLFAHNMPIVFVNYATIVPVCWNAPIRIVRTMYGRPAVSDLSTVKPDVASALRYSGAGLGSIGVSASSVLCGFVVSKREYAAGVRNENVACRAGVAIFRIAETDCLVYVITSMSPSLKKMSPISMPSCMHTPIWMVFTVKGRFDPDLDTVKPEAMMLMCICSFKECVCCVCVCPCVFMSLKINNT
jgi:hypothetical protein